MANRSETELGDLDVAVLRGGDPRARQRMQGVADASGIEVEIAALASQARRKLVRDAFA